MTFIVFAVAALLWSLALLRWLIPLRRRRAAALFIGVSFIVAIAAAASVISDLRVARVATGARASNLHISVISYGAWSQVIYRRGGVSFATADELHLPAGKAVDVTWSGLPYPWMERGACRPLTGGRSVMVVDRSTSARFVRLWRPMWREMRIVADDDAQFDRWFRDQTLPARVVSGPGPFLFVNSGCGYCHVIRGVTESPGVIAPDLTHFASHETIASTPFPIRRGQLSGWVVHSRGLLSDSQMPDNAIDPDALHPLVTYLESLR